MKELWKEAIYCPAGKFSAVVDGGLIDSRSRSVSHYRLMVVDV